MRKLIIFFILSVAAFLLICASCHARTEIRLSYVDGSVYSLNRHESTFWDKELEYYKTRLVLRNEIWINPDCWSIDTNYRYDFSEKTQRGIISMNWTRFDATTIAIGGGCYVIGPVVYPMFMAKAGGRIDFRVFYLDDKAFFYWPIPGSPEVRNDMKFGLMIQSITYFFVLNRSEFNVSKFENYAVAGFEFKW